MAAAGHLRWRLGGKSTRAPLQWAASLVGRPVRRLRANRVLTRRMSGPHWWWRTSNMTDGSLSASGIQQTNGRESNQQHARTPLTASINDDTTPVDQQAYNCRRREQTRRLPV